MGDNFSNPSCLIVLTFSGSPGSGSLPRWLVPGLKHSCVFFIWQHTIITMIPRHSCYSNQERFSTPQCHKTTHDIAIQEWTYEYDTTIRSFPNPKFSHPKYTPVGGLLAIQICVSFLLWYAIACLCGTKFSHVPDYKGLTWGSHCVVKTDKHTRIQITEHSQTIVWTKSHLFLKDGI